MKICSLLPSGTEILYALDLGDQLIGVSDLCDYPPAAREKPVVSRSRIDVASSSSEEVEEQMRRILDAGESPYELDLEWIWSESPDVVLTQDLCYFCEIDASTVNEAVHLLPAQPQVVVLRPRTLDEILDTIMEIGRVCKAQERAEELTAELRGRMEEVRRVTGGLKDRPKVFSLEGINPIAIGGHWIPDLLELAGGSQGPFPPGSPACRPDWETIRDYAPEKLFIDLCSSDLDRGLREVPWLAGLDGWWEVPAVQAGEVYLMDHVYFSNPGPRVIDGLEILAQLINPDRFEGHIPAGTVLKFDPTTGEGFPPADISRCFKPFPTPGARCTRGFLPSRE